MSTDAASRVGELVEQAVDVGARKLVGGRVSDAYVEPTVLADVPIDAEIVSATRSTSAPS